VLGVGFHLIHIVPRIVAFVSAHAHAIVPVFTRAMHGAMRVFTPAQAGFEDCPLFFQISTGEE